MVPSHEFYCYLLYSRDILVTPLMRKLAAKELSAKMMTNVVKTSYAATSNVKVSFQVDIIYCFCQNSFLEIQYMAHILTVMVI